jgi:energy-coupling factor transporter ATP-binding protein EcfA2
VSIQKLVIDGYRGIDHFEYEPNMINVFVGRNGTGKSSILEAIAIAYTAPTGFLDRLGTNVLERIIEEKGWEPEYLMHVNDERKEFRIVSVRERVEVSVRALYEKGGMSVPEPVKELVAEYCAGKRSEEPIVLLVGGERLEIGGSSAGEECVAEVLGGPLLHGQISPSYIHFAVLPAERKVLTRVSVPSDLIFYNFQPEGKLDAKHLYDILLPTGRISPVLGHLGRYVPYFDDLRSDGRTLWVHFEGQQPLPLSATGNGFRESVRFMLASSLVPGGVFIVDGFGKLHPFLAEMVAEWFAMAALKGRTQIFISTQDLEFIEKLLEFGGELVNLVRLYRIRDELAYEVLSRGEALEELDELRIDLRGP